MELIYAHFTVNKFPTAAYGECRCFWTESMVSTALAAKPEIRVLAFNKFDATCLVLL